jgi:hypothetical protein
VSVARLVLEYLLLAAAIVMGVRQAVLLMFVHARLSHHGALRVSTGFWVHLWVTTALVAGAALLI